MAKRKRINVKYTHRKMEVACDYLHKRIKLMLPYVYSAITLALWNILDETEEEKTEDIATLINESQRIWNECVDNNKNIVEWCEEVTGFNIVDGISGAEE